jgi:hypothetical protein
MLKKLSTAPISESLANLLTGSWLNWFTAVGDALKGVSGNGKVTTTTGVAVGSWKAIGGIVYVWGTHTGAIELPSVPSNPGPIFSSDGSVTWPIGASVTVNGSFYGSYFGG